MILAVLQTIENDQQRDAVEQLFRLYHKSMMVKAYEILHNWHDAEDAVQETFIKVSRNIDDFLPVDTSSAKSLIGVYTRNVAINIYNRKKRQNKLFYLKQDISEMNLESHDPDDNVLELVINQETIAALHQAIDCLDDMHRDVILLKYYYGKKNIEIADIMCVDVNVINARVFRAKKKLMNFLKEGRA